MYVIDGLCARMSVSTAAVGSSSDDILPEIIVPPSATSCVESVDTSVKLECVANARSYATLSLFYRAQLMLVVC